MTLSQLSRLAPGLQTGAGRIAVLGAAQLPINGRDHFRETERNIVGNMDHREAARLAHDLGVDLLVPMHWELFPHNRGFPHQLLEYVTTNYPQLSVLAPGRGATFRYSPT